MNTIQKHFEEAQKVLASFIADEKNIQQIEKAAALMTKAIKQGGKIISCGNGGSMCDAMHFAEELSGRYRNDRASIAAISISDPSHISCVANDYGYEFVFSRFVEGIGKSGDVLLGISTSGNSKNIINAVQAAKAKGIANICDVEIRAPYSEYADRAQEIHIKVIHSLIDYIESHL